jgi:hypothetical protein
MERREQIDRLAFEIYQNSGRVEGRELENWLEAKQIIMKAEAGKNLRIKSRKQHKRVIRNRTPGSVSI